MGLAPTMATKTTKAGLGMMLVEVPLSKRTSTLPPVSRACEVPSSRVTAIESKLMKYLPDHIGVCKESSSIMINDAQVPTYFHNPVYQRGWETSSEGR